MNKLLHEMQIAAKQAPRLYFAPFVGAVTAMKKKFALYAELQTNQPAKNPTAKYPFKVSTLHNPPGACQRVFQSQHDLPDEYGPHTP